MNVLVDSNVVSELRRGEKAEPRVRAWFTALMPQSVFTSVIVLGEIRRGIELMARHDKAQAEALERWYGGVREQLGDRVLAVDEPVMNLWARISVPDMLPAYDGLIAATALSHGLVVATRDTDDFRRVGVQVINPWESRT